MPNDSPIFGEFACRQKVGGAVFVAGWFTLMNLKTDEEKEIVKPWLENPFDFEKIKQHTKKFFAVFPDDDDVVPQENKNFLRNDLAQKQRGSTVKGISAEATE